MQLFLLFRVLFVNGLVHRFHFLFGQGEQNVEQEDQRIGDGGDNGAHRQNTRADAGHKACVGHAFCVTGFGKQLHAAGIRRRLPELAAEGVNGVDRAFGMLTGGVLLKVDHVGDHRPVGDGNE